MTDLKQFRKFIKWRLPVGAVIHDVTCSQPYVIKKNTVFDIHVWGYEDYNDEMRPEHEQDYYVEFACHDPGKHTRVHEIYGLYCKKNILTKYTEHTPWLN